MNKLFKQAAVVSAMVVVAAAGLAVGGVRPAFGTNEEKVTICHAAGLEGTTHYITLTIGREAVFGPAGHFFENGTPRAGHEQDYFGPCQTDTTTTDTTTTTTTEPCADCTITTICTNCNPPPPPPCPNGEPPIHGQDGNPGNDVCNPCDAPVNLEKCPPETTTTTTTTPPTTTEPVPTTSTTPTTPEPPVTTTVSENPPSIICRPGTHLEADDRCHGNEPPASKPPKKHAKPKPPPACPPGQPYNGRCGVQGSG